MNTFRPSSQQAKLAPGTSIQKSVSKSWEKLSLAPSKNTSSYDKQTSNQTGVTASSEKKSAAESKAKTVLTTAPAQSRRSGFNPKPNTSTNTSNNSRRHSLPSQKDIISQTKSKVNSGIRNNYTKALNKPSMETNTTGGASLPKSHAHQIQPKITNIQSQKKDSATPGSQKIFKNNPIYIQNRATSHNRFQEKTSVSSSGFLSNRASIPSYKSILRKVPSKSPISAKDEIVGSSQKDSANKLPQGTKNKQSLSKEDLMITSNRSNETSPVSDHSIEKLVEGSHEDYEPFESSIADAVIESSKEEQKVSHMERESPKSDTSPTNDREIIGTLNGTNKSLCLKEIGNEKFSCDEVKNSSMISEKDNDDPLNNPGASDMSTIVFDKKTFLEEQTNKEFSEFYRNEQKVMESIFRVKCKSLATVLKAELDIMESMFLAKQELPEIYSQIQQGALLLCSEMESETTKLIPIVKERVEELKRLMNKPRVEELQALKGVDGDSLQTKELGEISEESNDQDDIYKVKEKLQEFKKDAELLKLKLQNKKIPNEVVSLAVSLINELILSNSNQITLLTTLQNIVDAEEQSPNIVDAEEQSPNIVDAAEEQSPNIVDAVEQAQNIVDAVEQAQNIVDAVEPAQNIVSAKKQKYQSLERGSEKSAEVERVGEEPKTPLFLGVEESEKPMKGEAQVEIKKEAQANIEVSKASPVPHLKTRLLKFSQDKAITDMSHLPNDEGIELPFLDKIKAAIAKSASQNKEKEIESSFLDEEEAPEVSVQNEGEGEESKNPVKGEAEIEVTKKVKSEIRIPKKSSEPDLETSPLKSPDKSYLPNDGVELSFLEDMKKAIEKSASNSHLHDKEASEITLTNIKAGDKSIKQQSEFEDMENIQKEREIERQEKTLHQQSVRMKVLHTQETDTSKEDILGASVSETICSNDFELGEAEEEEISEKITTKRERVFITDRDTLTRALEALVAETLD